jgi:putative ATP-dependent endonuclease of OLD family
MRISKVKITSFKTIESVSFDLDNITVLIGENNSGKSNILKALDLFFEDSVRGISEEYFYFKDTSKPINIILTFTDLNFLQKSGHSKKSCCVFYIKKCVPKHFRRHIIQK